VPQIGFEGDLITVHGSRFTPNDELLIDHQVTAISVIDNQRFSFVVPAVAGGNKTIQLRRRNGKLSNKNSFAVQPRISTLLQGTRVQPGQLVTLQGSGFSPEASVIAERERVVGVQFVDINTLRFTVRRPANIRPNAAGEPMVLQVLVPQVPPSNTLEIALDTFRMMVFGDSILWGQGLVESQKIHNHVKSFMRQQHGDIETYCDLRAHSGAIIGIDDPTVAAALDGEIPTDYPTITQQAEATDIDAPETVDLVLVNGGINDINFRRILDPSVGEDTLRDLIDRHCRQDMERLLVRIADRFNKATIIVTGYYPIFSEESNLLSMTAFLSLLGVALAQIGGVLVGGVISIAMKDQVVRRAALFAAESEKCIQRAVDAANLQSSKRRVLFAQPEISRTHATLASDPWIFGVGFAGAPEDSAVAPGRAMLCESAPAGRCDVTTCRVASMGHPNARGAQAYAEEITALLHTQTSFPEKFLWGVATAGYQVEGGPTANDWDIFTQSEAIRDRVHRLAQHVGQDVELAPVGDAVQHRQIEVLKQDLDRAQLLGLNAYRFSIEWPRVEPSRGQVNDAELTYYDRVFDELKQRGLEPIVTLNHMTLPQWVLTPSAAKDPVSGLAVPDQSFNNSLRGWETLEVVDCFAGYVRAVVERYKDKVKTWITLNEPVGSMVGLGYLAGIWPPGFSLDGRRARQAYFNLLKAHVRAYDVIKAIYGPDGQSRVGIAHAMLYGRLTPAGGGLGDINVAETNQFNYFYNEHLLNSLVNERVDVSIDRHPADRDYRASTDLYGLTSWEKKLDFLGLNYYRSVYVGHDPILNAVANFAGGFFDNDLRDSDDQHQLLNDMGWEIYPKGIYHILKYIHDNYDLPVLIAENGISQAVDCHRAPFTVSHLQQVLRAIQEGVKVQGYIHWTLVDNYEWQDHYRSRSRFGLFTVNRTGETQPFRRCITEGALALQYIIADNAVEQAAEKFGNMAANASSVSPPVQNAGALWVSDGTAAENPTILKLNLYLSKLSPTGYLGMIFLHESHTWHRLETIEWNGRTLSFEFTDTDHALIRGTAISTDNTLRGELGYSPPRSWQAKRETLSGTWRSERSPHYVHFHGLEHPSANGWSGKYHTLGSHRSHRRWVSGYLTQTDDRVNFDMDDDGIFNGSLPQASDSMLAGDIRLVGGGGGATMAWRAQRLPDYIP
jgi:beta-glucosidase/6-phospho-beta-glucosidase/beta-galactosidase/lysophospholipase L1-like esterase